MKISSIKLWASLTISGVVMTLSFLFFLYPAIMICSIMLDPQLRQTGESRCMPSKVLIHIVNVYHQRNAFDQQGIQGGEHLHADITAVMREVRALRDRVTNGMIAATRQLAADDLLLGKAVLEGPHRIRVGEHILHAQNIILAKGARGSQRTQKVFRVNDKIFRMQWRWNGELSCFSVHPCIRFSCGVRNRGELRG